MRKLLFFITLLTLNSLLGQDKTPNIILLIGDGMGLTQISAGMYANDNSTALEGFEYVGLSKTHAIKQLITDSAASGTAMACGVKTFNGAIGIDDKNQQHRSIIELCKERGYATGLIATSSIVHATPASFYAKVPSRKQYEEIALQLSQHNVDLFVGGGKKYFSKRSDDRNLIQEMSQYKFVKNFREFKNATAEKIGFLTYNEEPPRKMEGRTPDLESLVETSLQKMESLGAPFFMMIEGSQIDWGGHANETNYVITEFQEFNLTIQKVLDYAKADGNTLVIVTADHETGGFAITGGNLDLAQVKGDFNTKSHSASMVPVFSYGPNSELFKGIYENTAIFDKMWFTVQGASE
ncbi:alkaline phosphatase [Flavobacteriaceae bacterium]|nr:alkaline phosphatase [Flavobacteriaceae bacterium]MDA9037956.1 alkaline phosphatase [Flavobacteriaceae bacterium]